MAPIAIKTEAMTLQAKLYCSTDNGLGFCCALRIAQKVNANCAIAMLMTTSKINANRKEFIPTVEIASAAQQKQKGQFSTELASVGWFFRYG